MILPLRHQGRISVVVLIAAALVAAAGIFYAIQTRRAKRLKQENLALRAEQLRLRQEAVRAVDQVRDERLRAASAQTKEATAGGPTIEAEPNGILERVLQLKGYSAAHPERSIPEMRLLTDEEWMQQAKDADLDTEVGNRKALYMLRQYALNKSGRMVTEALKAYLTANAGTLPSDTAQLIPYLPNAKDAEYIAQFQRSDEIPPPLPTDPNVPPTVWVFKASPQVDPWFPYTYYVGQNGEQGMVSQGPLYRVEDAVAKYRKAFGTQPTDAAQLIPYLEAPVPTSVLQDIFNGMRKSRP